MTEHCDLWNQPIGSHKRKTPLPGGHAGKPGSGPQGETCGSCSHLTRVKYAKTYLKCGLLRDQWTNGPGTDIRAKDAACWKWQTAAVAPVEEPFKCADEKTQESVMDCLQPYQKAILNAPKFISQNGRIKHIEADHSPPNVKVRDRSGSGTPPQNQPS